MLLTTHNLLHTTNYMLLTYLLLTWYYVLLQARLKVEQAEAYEARLRYLEEEVSAKQERLRRTNQEAEHAQGMLRKQQSTMAEGEQALQRMRTVELPSLRDELRREASRAAGSDAKLAAVEQQLGATSQALLTV